MCHWHNRSTFRVRGSTTCRVIRLERSGAWTLVRSAEKLRLRHGLPGAFAYDRAAAALRVVAKSGAKKSDLLPLVFASSWLVNNSVPAPVFRKWLSPPLLDVWMELAALIDGGPNAWLDLSAEEQQMIQAGIATLAIDGHGAGAISKPLALLAPDTVPLMPDAAIAFALGRVARPEAPDAQTAGIETFSPMMSWFARAVLDARDALDAIAKEHASATGIMLSAAQVLDRLLWFDSVGYRHFKTKAAGWWWVSDGPREAVVHVPGTFEGASTTDRIDLTRDDLAPAFRDAARGQLP